jgi:para-aminobenzoate synthetase/4-amino-4-deoxychorismate lyase
VRPCARFTSGEPGRATWTADGGSVELDVPRAVHVARRVEEVVAVVAEADRAAARGEWAAVMIAYEAAAAFDPAMPRPARSAGEHDLPLAWVAVFGPSAVVRHPPHVPTPAVLRTPPVVAAATARIAEHIAAGDTYQVNYTFALHREGSGHVDPGELDPWLDALCAAQEAGYGARLDLGRHVVLSASPELFVERRGTRLRARPMKGTSPRGRWLEEDLARRDALVGSEKIRAETGSVQVPALFTPERYPTVWQLTSTIEASVDPDAGRGVVDLMRALFPCGSVTGAPKIRTMALIAELEIAPRGVYTGAIGLVQPGGDATFSVAIRTLVVERATGRATLGIGAGIVADSKADEEYDECLLKGAFAETSPVAGAPAVIRVPPAAQREFELLETVRVEDGRWLHLPRHLDRLAASAHYFGFPWDRAAVDAAIAGNAAPPGVARGRVRLLANGRASVETLPLAPFGPVRRVALARTPVDANDVFLCHKTTRREVYTRAQATRPDVDDVILWNTRGEVTESTIANVIVGIGGQRFTPPRTCGLLAGVGRGLLLESGAIRERVITVAELKAASRVWLVSALRGEVEARLVS